MEKITYDIAVSQARAELDKMGRDYVYPRVQVDDGVQGCVYFDPAGQPSCIMGHIGADFWGWDWETVEGENSAAITSVLVEQHDYDITEKAVEFFKLLQAQQDSGASWGDAFDYAVEGVARGTWYEDETGIAALDIYEDY